MKTIADYILHNAKIYTLDNSFSVREAMVIKDGKILAAGQNSNILQNYQAKHKIDVQRGYIYPGFIDAHCHLSMYAAALQEANLYACSSFEEAVKRLILFQKENPHLKIHYRTGMGPNQMAACRFPR